MENIRWTSAGPVNSCLAGWDAELDGEYIGTVWLDGSYSLAGHSPVHFGSHAIAAAKFLEALKAPGASDV